jgi:hypothetical protein
MWWKKKDKKKEEKEEPKEGQEEGLLHELCGDDAKLYGFLSYALYENPLTAVSKNDLDALIEEAEKTGNYGPAVDKAIFEGSQNPGESEKYVKVLRDLAAKNMQATEPEKEKAEKEGLTDRIASLEKRIENQKFMSERAEDIIRVATGFYNEKLVGLGEDARREERERERRRVQSEELRTGQLESAEQEARKKEIKKMGGEERREAEKQEKLEEQAARERKVAREEDRKAAEIEEKRIKEQEEAEREARRKDREGNQG